MNVNGWLLAAIPGPLWSRNSEQAMKTSCSWFCSDNPLEDMYRGSPWFERPPGAAAPASPPDAQPPRMEENAHASAAEAW